MTLKKKRGFNPYSFFLGIISYVMVLMLPVLVYSISWFSMTKNTQKSMYEGNVAIVQQMQQLFDNRVKEAINFQFYLAENKYFTSLFPLSIPLSTQTRYDLWKASEHLNASLKYTALFSGGYLYLWATDTTLYNGSIYNYPLLYEIMHKNSDIEPMKWRDILTTYNANNLYALKQKDGTYQIYLLASIPFDRFLKTAATLVLCFNDMYLPHDIIGMEEAPQSCYILLDDLGQVICANDLDPNIRNEIDFQAMTGNSGYFQTNTRLGLMLVSYATSANTMWKYVSLTPLEALTQKQLFYKRIVLLSTVVSTSVGLALAVWLARRRLYYFEELFNKIQRGLYGETKAIKPEMMDQMLDEMIRSRKQLDAVIERQNNTLRNHMLERLFTPGQNALQTGQALKTLGIDLSGCYLTLACFFVHEPASVELNNSDCQWYLEACCKQLLTQLQKVCLCYSIYSNNIQFVLFSHEQAQISLSVKQVTNQTIYSQNFMIGCCFAQTADSIEQISTSYIQLINWMKTTLHSCDRQQAIFEIGIIKHDKKHLFMTVEQQELLFATMQSGQIQNVEKLIDKLCEQISPDIDLQALIHCYLYDMLKCILRIVKKGELSLSIAEELAKFEKTDIIYNKIQSIKNIAGYVIENTAPEEKENDLFSSILKVLEENYTRTDFNIQCLADMMNRNASYISKVFKDVTGIGLYDYLTRMRIEKAKEIIDHSNAPISTLIEQAGFENVGSFIRVFKKYEGITPGKYQKDGKNRE